MRRLVHLVLHPFQHRFAKQGYLPLDVAGKGNELGRRERCRMALEFGDCWQWSVCDQFQ